MNLGYEKNSVETVTQVSFLVQERLWLLCKLYLVHRFSVAHVLYLLSVIFLSTSPFLLSSVCSLTLSPSPSLPCLYKFPFTPFFLFLSPPSGSWLEGVWDWVG